MIISVKSMRDVSSSIINRINYEARNGWKERSNQTNQFYVVRGGVVRDKN